MRSIYQKLANRFRNVRRSQRRLGSVLILVVALLVLMALIGTAFISTTRVDRAVSVQNVVNTQIDLILEGAKNIAKGVIVGDLIDPSATPRLRSGPRYTSWTIPMMLDQDEANDNVDPTYLQDSKDHPAAWLSPRLPVWEPGLQKATNDPVDLMAWIDPQATWNSTTQNTLTGLNQTGAPVWPVLGAPLVASTGTTLTSAGAPVLSNSLFESPFAIDASNSGTYSSSVPLTYHNRVTASLAYRSSTAPVYNHNHLVPYTYKLNYPDGSSQNVPVWAVQVYTANPPNGKAAGNYWYYYLAGDADGDGVADCGMSKMPVGQLDGLTYYVGYRIIDNGSALNVNTALSRNWDFNGNGAVTIARDGTNAGVGMFILGETPSTVGLAELLTTYAAPAVGTVPSMYSLGIGSTSGTTNMAEFGAINAYRMGSLSTSTGTFGIGGVITAVTGTGTGSATLAHGATLTYPTGTFTVAGQSNLNMPVYNGSGGAIQRPDFVYASWGDAQWTLLGSRTANPGVLYDANTGSLVTCRPFDRGDAMSLAYHFVMANPNSSLSSLENLTSHALPNMGSLATSTNVQDSLYWTSPGLLSNNAGSFLSADKSSYNLPSGPLVLAKWYADNFDFNGNVGANFFPPASYTPYYPQSSPARFVQGAEDETNAQATFHSRRSLFTTFNPVTLQSPGVGNLTNIVAQNPAVIRPPVAPAAAQYAQADLMSDPTTTRPQTCINTADFGDLWRAFFLTMASSPQGGATSVSPMGDTAATNPYVGEGFATNKPSDWTNPNAQKPGDPNTPGTYFNVNPNAVDPQRMFRSGLRDVGTITTAAGGPSTGGTIGFSYYIAPDQMVLLRSALAGANAEGIRDSMLNAGTYSVNDNSTNTVASQYACSLHRFPLLLSPIPAAAAAGGPGPAPGPAAAPLPVDVTVYPATRQPYIQEVYANTNVVAAEGGGQNSKAYVAIELVNPYPDPIYLDNWKIVLLDRRPPTALPSPYQLPTVPAAQILTFPANTKVVGAVPGKPGHLLIENFGDAGVTHRPPSTLLPPNSPLNATTSVMVTNLDTALDHELVFMRPVYDPANPASAPIDYAPADSYDFTGLNATGTPNAYEPANDQSWTGTDGDPSVPGQSGGPAGNSVTGRAHTWHYVRGLPTNWGFIYPGRYDASQAPDPAYPRQQGTQVSVYYPTSPSGTNKFKADPFDPAAAGDGGVAPDPYVTFGDYKTAGPYEYSSYPSAFPFQILNTDQPGAMTQLAPNFVGPAVFPFGMFARPTDMLQVPFCGSYKITAQGAGPWNGAAPFNVIELNAMPIDSAFAEDSDTEDDPMNGDAPGVQTECVGHFVPIFNANSPVHGGNLIGTINDYQANGGTYSNNSAATLGFPPPTQNNLRYKWALKLFDYLTTYTPTSDYFPNVRPSLYGPWVYGATPQATGAGNFKPVPVANAYSTASDAELSRMSGGAGAHTEDSVSVDGRINLNTASWRVLSSLRLNVLVGSTVTRTNSFTYAVDDVSNPTELTLTGNPDAHAPLPDEDNVKLAKIIAYYRDGHHFAAGDSDNPTPGTPLTLPPHGPYRSYADVLKLHGIQVYTNQYSTNDPDDAQGDFSPFNATLPAGTNGYTDGVRNDYEERLLILNSLAATTTIRSDTFTVYIIVQGWKNAGSTDPNNPPKLITQRRAAFIADRSGVTTTNTELKITNIPTD